jgi:hypothetical protein
MIIGTLGRLNENSKDKDNAGNLMVETDDVADIKKDVEEDREKGILVDLKTPDDEEFIPFRPRKLKEEDN